MRCQDAQDSGGTSSSERGRRRELDELPKKPRLAFDHGTILKAAVGQLRSKGEYTSLPAFLLPEPFTLPQLQRVYEVVLDRAVDKSWFRTRMLVAQFLEQVGYADGRSKRPAMLSAIRSALGGRLSTQSPSWYVSSADRDRAIAQVLRGSFGDTSSDSSAGGSIAAADWSESFALAGRVSAASGTGPSGALAVSDR